MAVPYAKIPGAKSRRLENAVPGVARRGGSKMVGWIASERALKRGLLLEIVSLVSVGVFFLLTLMELLLPEMKLLSTSAFLAGGISFLLSHGLPLVVDSITGGRARLGFWAIGGFWLTILVERLLS